MSSANPLEASLDPAALLLTSRSLRRAQEAIGKQDIGCLNEISAKRPNAPLCSPRVLSLMAQTGLEPLDPRIASNRGEDHGIRW